MKRFPSLISFVTALVLLFAGVGSVRATVITTGDVNPGGAGSQPDPWVLGFMLNVGNNGNGTLNVEAGGAVSNTYGYVGKYSGSTGEATVTGADSEWTNSNSLTIGGHDSEVGGSGTLNLYDSGLVTVLSTTKLWSTGIINLDGGSLTTGSFNNTDLGTLNFHDGTLTVNGVGGSFDPGTTNFTIDGLAATDLPELAIANTASTTLSNLYVGSSTQGKLTVKTGGVVSGSVGYIGYSLGSNGTATVIDEGSQWNNSGPLRVGYDGDGTLQVQGGGVVSNAHSSIGTRSSSTGMATVTGTDSHWDNSSNLYVGSSGNGILAVELGGLVSNTTGYVGYQPNSSGTVTITGNESTWNNNGSLYLGGSSYSSGGTANVSVLEGGTLSVDGATKIYSGSTLTLSGLASSLQLGGDFTNEGTFDWQSGTVVLNSGGSWSNPLGVILTESQTLQLNGGSLPDASDVTADGTLDLGGNHETIDALAGSGSVTLGGGNLTIGAANGGDTFSGVISEAGNVNKSGAGTQTLSGANTFDGNLTVSGGALILSGSNTYTGSTNIVSGVLQAGAAGVLPDASDVTADGSLDLNGNNETIGALAGSGSVTLGGGDLAVGSSNGSGTFSGVISGSGNVTKTGAGTQTVSGANTFGGDLTVNGGTLILSGGNTYSGLTNIVNGILRAGAAEVLPDASDVTADGKLDLGGNHETIDGLAGSGSVTLGGGDLTVGSSNGSGIFSGVISESGNVTKNGTGAQTLTGANTFAGNLTVSGGTLILSGGNTYSGLTNIVGGTLQLGAAGVIPDASDVTADGKLDLNGNNDTIGALAGSGSVTLGGGDLTVGSSNESGTFSGVISEAGNVTKTGAGTQTLSGANTFDGNLTVSGGALDTSGPTLILSGPNTYSGSTFVGSGTLLLGAAGVIPDASDLTVEGTLDLGGNHETIDALAGSGSVTLGGGDLTVGSSNGSGTFSGVISEAGNVTKTGTGAQTLTGDNTFAGNLTVSGGTLILSGDNTYSGLTNIVSGTVQAGAAEVLPDASDVTADGKLDLNGNHETIGALAGSGSVTLGGGDLTVGSSNGSGTFSGVISEAGNVNKSGSGAQTLTGANTFDGNLTVSGGALILSGGNTYSGLTNIVGGTLQLGAAGVIPDASDVTADGTLDLGGNNETIDAVIGSGSVTLGGGDLTVGAGNGSGTFSGVISGSGNFTKSGSGTQTLSGSNTFAGNLTVDGGVLTLSGANTYSGSTIVTSGTLQLGAAGVVPDTSDLTVSGGTLDLDGNDETIGALAGSGPLTLGGGNLTIGAGGGGGIFSGVISEAGNVTKTGAGTQTVSGANTFGGDLTVNGGTLILSGANTYSGSTLVTSGTLQLGAAGVLPDTSDLTVSGGTLDLDGNDETIGGVAGSGSVTLGGGNLTIGAGGGGGTFSGAISEAGNVTKTGAGAQTLSGANTFDGNLTVSDGTLNVTDGGLVDVTGMTRLHSTGTITLDGGTIHTQSWDNAQRGAFHFRDGVLTVDGGTFDPGTSNFTINGNSATDNPTLRFVNGASNNGLTDNLTLTVGYYTGDAATVDIESGAVVASATAYLGYYGHNTSSATGTVTVAGVGSRWTNIGLLNVGYHGSGILNITDGGAVSDTSGKLGANNYSSGQVTVSGPGSTWTNTENLYVASGGQGSIGTLEVTNGGSVSNTAGYIGRLKDATGEVTISGPGSSWINTGELYIAGDPLIDQSQLGGSGTLTVANGGAVSSVNGSIASFKQTYTANPEPGATGVATVTGPGSTWTVTGHLNVGRHRGLDDGGSGTLNILDSGAVNVTETVMVGSTGHVLLDGGSLTAHYLDGAIDFVDGTLTIHGETGPAVNFDFLSGLDGPDMARNPTLQLVEGAQGSFDHLQVGHRNRGTLHVASRGTLFSNSAAIGVGDEYSNPVGLVTVSGLFEPVYQPSHWFSGPLTVGGSGGNGTVNIDSGAQLVSQDSFIGIGDLPYGNTSGSAGIVTVSGNHSTWDNVGTLYVGSDQVGPNGNGSVDVDDGGAVRSHMTYLGYVAGATGAATVTGTDSTWTTEGDLILDQGGYPVGQDDGNLYVGYEGAGSLEVADGGAVTNDYGYIAYGESSSGTVLVTGPGSKWTNAKDLAIGQNQPGAAVRAELTVSNGGLVEVAGTIDLHNTGRLTLEGGSLNTGSFDVTADDSFTAANSFTFTGGALTVDGGTFNPGTPTFQVDGGTATDNPTLRIIDGATTTGLTGNLTVGYNETGTLSVESGGSVSNLSSYIGREYETTGAVTVTGADSTWTNAGWLSVGFTGSGTLEIADGGAVSNTTGVIAGQFHGTGEVTVTGPGSVWTNSDELMIADCVNQGGPGCSGTLNVTNGGSVSSTAGFIGPTKGATGTATISGSESKWINTADLHIAGYASQPNETWLGGSGTITVADGGLVSSVNGSIGDATGSVGQVTVTGASSQWTNAGDLLVGGSGSGTLSVADGGVVSNVNGSVGVATGSAGQVTVTGASSQWTNAGDLVVGGSSVSAGGSGTLTITGSGQVRVGGALKIWDTVNLDNGMLITGSLNYTGGGTFNWVNGTLQLTGPSGLTVGPGGTFGELLTLNADQTLKVDHTTTVQSSAAMTTTGEFSSGQLTIESGAVLNATGQVTAKVGGLMTSNIVATGPLSIGDATGYGGFDHQGVLSVGIHDVTLNTKGFANLGSVTTLEDGTLHAANGVYLRGGSVLAGSGTVDAKLAAGFGSTIAASGDLNLGSATSVAGFFSDGDLIVDTHTVTIHDQDIAVLGSLTDLGSESDGGTLVAPGGLLIEQGKSLAGRGLVTGDVVNDGNVYGDSPDVGGRLVFDAGYTVSGTGGFTNAQFDGTYSPGHSPAIAHLTDTAFGSSATLAMELGGLVPGVEHDKLVMTGTTNLDGMLEVMLINGFTPGSGDTFDIFDFATLSGSFSAMNLPVLDGGLVWDTSQLLVDGSLCACAPLGTGDYNGDGVVDAADYTVWRDTLGSQLDLRADGTGDGMVDEADYVFWNDRFGNVVGTGSRVAVPEPTSVVLVIAGLLAVVVAAPGPRRTRATASQPLPV